MNFRLVALLLGLTVWAAAAPRRNILLLNSYRAGFEWTDQITRGISVWAETKQAGELWVVYMDARRYEGRDLNGETERRMRDRFGAMSFDLILTTDDEAFEFVRDRGERLFPGVPVVAGGIGEEVAGRIPRERITGVLEIFNVRGALDLAFRLHPRATNLYAVTDGSPLGVQFREHIEGVRAEFTDRLVHVIDVSGRSLSEAARDIRALPEDSILMICHVSQYPEQALINRTEATRSLASAAPGPVYALSENAAGNGVLAASATNGAAHAELMTRQATRLLLGETPGRVPLLRDENHDLLFDYRELKKWGIDERDLPAWATIVNRPLSFLAEYTGYIYAAGAFLALQMAIIAALVVSIRRRHKAEAELKQALDAANEAALLKTRFLANVSHELRTPLNGILGMSHLLNTTNLSGEQEEYNSLTAHSARSLVKIVDDLLDLAQLESGQLRLKPEPFRIREEIDRLVGLLQPRAMEQKLSLFHCIETDVPEMVAGDYGRLRQVLTNLVGNALKFTPRGGVRVTVTPGGCSDGTARIRFEVADTGVGIAAGDLERIFDPFTQVDNSPTRRVGGVGLGLAISRHLVHMMGGELQVESAPGQGSRFWFELPFRTVTGGVAPPAPVVSKLRDGPFAGRRVLVVEDNDVNRRVAQRLLEKAGCEVHTARGGAEGIGMLGAGPFDLVLMDIQMPGLSGLETAQQIRRDEPGGARTPIVAMTASAMKQDREQCAAAGMDDFLEKPIELAALDDVLNRWLRRNGDAAATRAG
jgi:signal transduction histidine kinase/ActR/RegA family two-component response regulator